MRFLRTVRIVLGSLLLGSLPPALLAAGTDLVRLQQLLHDQQYERAYELADKASAESAGDPAFDYLYGLAALESGRGNRAVYALERVLMAEPGNEAAQLVLARAYAKAGQLDLARALLNTILARNSDTAVSEAARTQLAALPSEKLRSAARWTGALELSLGYDNNVNATTDLEQLPTPPATILTLGPSALAQADEFLRLDFETRVERDAGANGMWFAGVSGYENYNFHERAFDTTFVNVQVGGAYRSGNHRAVLYGSYQRLWLDYAGYLAVVSPGLAWQYALGADGRLELAATYADYRYDQFGTRDIDGLTVSLGWRQVFNLTGRPQLQLSAYHGDERAKDSLFDYFGRDVLGAQLRGDMNVAVRHFPYFQFRWQTSEYQGLDPIYAVSREDSYLRVGLGWRYRLQPRLYLGIEADYTKNQSSILLYEFERTRAYFTTRYEWR